MRAIAIIVGFLAGPSILLILARRLGGKKLVHRVWRWGLRWIYGLILAASVLALIYVALFEGIEGDDGPAFFAGFVGVVAIVVSGAITLVTYRLLALEPEA
jgi:amino acid transporter